MFRVARIKVLLCPRGLPAGPEIHKIRVISLPPRARWNADRACRSERRGSHDEIRERARLEASRESVTAAENLDGGSINPSG
jgi:hypothetical protein